MSFPDDTIGGAEDMENQLPHETDEMNQNDEPSNDRDHQENGERPESETARIPDREPALALVTDAEEAEAGKAQDGIDTQQPGSEMERHADPTRNNPQRSRRRRDRKDDAPAGPNSSLDQLQSSLAWEQAKVIEAGQVPLPPSESSSILSTHDQAVMPLPLGQSLEDLELNSKLSPENIPLPRRKKIKPLMTWIAGSSSTKKETKTKKKKEVTIVAPRKVNSEVENYRTNINRLAAHLDYFENVSATETRHHWSSQIVLYDILEDERHRTPRRREPWPDRASAPSYVEFKKTLRTVDDTCEQRLVLIEDLNPSLINLLGATFDIPPHVFEEHLDRSGYKNTVDSRTTAAAWNPRSSAQGYSSVTWYRPVLPLVPLDSRFRAKLLKERSPKVRCPLEDCEEHMIPLGTTGNIWRHYIELSYEPGNYHRGSDTAYPVGWEERATVWSRDLDGCKFVIILLDPLPVVVLQNPKIRVSRYERLIPMGNHWISKEEGMYVEHRSRSASRHSRSQNPRNHHDYVFEWSDQVPIPVHSIPQVRSDSGPTAPPAPAHSESDPTATDHLRATGADLDPSQAAFTPTALRRRATKTDMEQTLNEPFVGDYTSKINNRKKDAPSKKQPGVAQSIPPPPLGPPPPSDPLPPPPPPPALRGVRYIPPSPFILPPPQSLSAQSSSSFPGSAADKEHGPFVPYDHINGRSSSSARDHTTFVTKSMRAYIESLQIPKSTLQELDHVLQQPTKGKESQYDPFHALFRAIHDDSHSLVDIVRNSLQRIREGTLDEDLMQRRVTFWRALLHRLSFNLGDLDQNLRAFARFINEPEAHTSRAQLPSEKLADATCLTLRNCMELIDKSSHSLLAEMQIVDSRRSIAEAESVSKLTELAFVFIPLSFVASLFSMQVHELNGGVPLYQFTLVAIAFVVVAYAVRLSIRSSRLIDQKNHIFAQIREESDLQSNDRIPTHTFLAWVGSALGATISKNTKNAIVVLAPVTLVAAVLAALLSPIVLLWLRGIDRGFTAVMTVLLLLLDIILVVPIVIQTSGTIQFNPRELIREIQEARKKNQSRRKKAKRRRRPKPGENPELTESDSEQSRKVI